MLSYVEDVLCDGGSLEWECNDEFDDLMEHEMQKITFEDLENHELEQIKFIAFKLCNELASRIDAAIMLNGFIKSQTSLLKLGLFFNNKGHLKSLQQQLQLKNI